MSQLKHDAGSKETILLRHAAPKYNFSGRKLPKESTEITSSGNADYIASSLDSSAAHFPLKTDNAKYKPIAVVGASIQLPGTTTVGNFKTGISPFEPTQTVTAVNTVTHDSSCQNLSISRSHSNRSDSQNIPTEGVSVNLPLSLSDSASSQQNLSSTQYMQSSVNACATLAERNQLAAVPFMKKDHFYLVTEHGTWDANLKHLENERDQLKKELQVQLQVNSELKRLLVASVGDDLSQRVERLCR